MDEYGLANLYQTCKWILEKPNLLIDYVSNEAGMQPSVEQPSNYIFQLINGNKIPSIYIRGIDNPQMAIHIL